MAQPLLLVDFENVQTIDVQHIPPDYRIAFFCGANQKSASLDLTTRLQDLGSRVQWQRVSGTGKNALDFHIAFHIGRVLERKAALSRSDFVFCLPGSCVGISPQGPSGVARGQSTWRCASTVRTGPDSKFDGTFLSCDRSKSMKSRTFCESNRWAVADGLGANIAGRFSRMKGIL